MFFFRYIYYATESASYPFMSIVPFNGKFNWTMTYRLDSDIPRPYGYIVQVGHAVNISAHEYKYLNPKLR